MQKSKYFIYFIDTLKVVVFINTKEKFYVYSNKVIQTTLIKSLSNCFVC